MDEDVINGETDELNKSLNALCPAREECLTRMNGPIGMYHCPSCGEMILAGHDTAPMCPHIALGQRDEAGALHRPLLELPNIGFHKGGISKGFRRC